MSSQNACVEAADETTRNRETAPLAVRETREPAIQEAKLKIQELGGGGCSEKEEFVE